MKLSDIIAAHILKIMDESENNSVEIQRNELAASIGCVPSQINYVISSRFIPEHGYIVDSKRGGGGYIRISRVKLDRSSAIMHLINTIGVSLDDVTARVMLENCIHGNLFDESTVNLMYSAISSSVMRHVPVQFRDNIRAAILKEMLIATI